MMKRYLILSLLLLPLLAWSQGRIARVTKGIFLYSNWDAPCVTLDTCLDMTITEAHIPVAIEHNGRTYPVAEIGHGAFQGCHNLTTVYLSEEPCGILRDAFHDCPNLRVIVCPCRKPSPLENNHPFYGGKFNDIFETYHAQSVILVVPQGCEEIYRNSPGWAQFKHIQSTMPTQEEIQSQDVTARILQLESQLARARAEVQRLEQELMKLKPRN